MSFTESHKTHLQRRHLQVLPFSLLLLCFPSALLGLNQDGVFLLSLKSSVLRDPLWALSDWNSEDESPCSWNGVMCKGFPASENESWSFPISRVISLVLPSSQLYGSISSDLGRIEHLRHLDLSGNALNGTLPLALFNASELRVLSLSDNDISGEVPDLFGNLQSLQVLNLSGNALTGPIPKNLTFLPNLTAVSLSNNYLSGELSGGGFKKLEFLDLGSNLVSGSLPPDLTGGNLRYLNLSSNQFSGEIPPQLGSSFLGNVATLDLSFNNFSGEIPPSSALLAQKAASFLGNQHLCGRPLQNLCGVPSTLSNPPNKTEKAPPAFAAIPKGNQGEASHGSAGLKPTAIAAIAIGDLAGLGLLLILILLAHHIRKKQGKQSEAGKTKLESFPKRKGMADQSSSSCFGKETESSASSEGGKEREEEGEKAKGGILVSVDGETEVELETLLKASAYILGAAGGSILYKAVLADGTSFAVRRIGDSSASFEKLRDFEAQIRAIAKLRHPNLLPLRCFFWGSDEKLLIHDYASNGSLANFFLSKKLGGSSMAWDLGWEGRVRVAKGAARGLSYLHEKKWVHGNIKPSNILLSADMEAMIGDLGLDRLLLLLEGEAPARRFGSKRSTFSQGSLPAPSPYQAPESLSSLSPSPKWDVYSFGMLLLELFSGRLFLEVELISWTAALLPHEEERAKALKLADPALRPHLHGKEDSLLALFKLGFACANPTHQKRPSMKDALHLIQSCVSDN